MIEEIVLNTFKSYRINNIKYNADNGLCSKYLYIDLKTHNNKTVLLSFVERNTDGIFIWPPHINYEDLQTHSTIILYNYLKYRGLIKEKAEFDKYRIFGNINSSKEEIKSLFMMTPYAYRTPASGRARLAELTSLTTEIEFYLFTYKKAN